MKLLNILTVMAIVAILSSCASRSGRRQTEGDKIQSLKEEKSYPIWNIMNKKTVFVYHDRENQVFPMKSAGLDSIMISRVTVIHSDTTKSDQNIFTEWGIPATDDYPNNYTMEIDGRDTIHHYYETMTFPSSAFKLKR